MNININNLVINLKSANWHQLSTLNSGDEWWLDIISFLKQWANSYNTIDIHTSGSTGDAKIISVQKKHMIASAKMTCNFFNLNSDTTGLLCLSANYIAGKMMLVRAIVSGMNLICVAPSQNPVKELNCSVNFSAMVPYQVQYALKTPQKYNLIQNLIIGGGQVSTELVKNLKKHKVNAFETFGMTETLSHIAIKQITPNIANYFTVLQGVTIAKGNNNELIIDAPHLGIKNLATTDIVDIKHENTFIWKGRLDFIINSGGVKISPEEVEGDIANLITENYCIVGTPSKELGEQIVLVIEGAPFQTALLKAKIRAALPSYYCPKEIKFIDEFPKTESGKIKRKVLKNMLI